MMGPSEGACAVTQGLARRLDIEHCIQQTRLFDNVEIKGSRRPRRDLEQRAVIVLRVRMKLLTLNNHCGSP